MELLTSQKLSLLSIASEAGLTESDFEFIYETSIVTDYLIVRYKPKERYSITYRSNAFSDKPFANVIPGKSQLEEYVDIDGHLRLDFEFIEKTFRVWIQNLQKEVPLDSLLERIQKGQFVNEEFFNSDEKFSATEAQILVENIGQLQLKINMIPLLLDDQKKIFIAELEDLKKKTDKLTKKDFYLMLIGTIVGPAMQMGLNSDTMKSVWYVMKVLLRTHPILLAP